MPGEPWRDLAPAEAERLERELGREVRAPHILHGVEVRVIARRVDTDDVLVALADGRVAVVHLTWAGGQEARPEQFPWTTVFDRKHLSPRDRLELEAAGQELEEAIRSRRRNRRRRPF
jgi:hypothetical protein